MKRTALLAMVFFLAAATPRAEELAPLTMPEPVGVEGLIATGMKNLALDPAKSIQLFRQALAQEPGNRKAKFSICTALIKMEKYKEAQVVFDSLISQYPDDFILKNNLAWMYATATDPAFRDGKKALELARDALLNAPSSCHVWSTLSEAHYVSMDYEKALQAAREALRLAQLDPNGKPSIPDYESQIKRAQQAVDALTLIE